MRMVRTALFVAAACAALLLPSCKSTNNDTFTNGTYNGSVGQVLVIAGDDFSYTVIGYTFSGAYVIDGNSVTFNTTKMNGQSTGLNQKTAFDFTSTSNSITLTNARDTENGGCGIAPDTFTK